MKKSTAVIPRPNRSKHWVPPGQESLQRRHASETVKGRASDRVGPDMVWRCTVPDVFVFLLFWMCGIVFYWLVLHDGAMALSYQANIIEITGPPKWNNDALDCFGICWTFTPGWKATSASSAGEKEEVRHPLNSFELCCADYCPECNLQWEYSSIPSRSCTILHFFVFWVFTLLVFLSMDKMHQIPEHRRNTIYTYIYIYTDCNIRFFRAGPQGEETEARWKGSAWDNLRLEPLSLSGGLVDTTPHFHTFTVDYFGLLQHIVIYCDSASLSYYVSVAALGLLRNGRQKNEKEKPAKDAEATAAVETRACYSWYCAQKML